MMRGALRAGGRPWALIGCAALAASLCLPASRGWSAEESEPVLSPSLERDIAAQAAAHLNAKRPVAEAPARPPGIFRAPIDYGYAHEAWALYCPDYLPKLHPEKNLDEMCRENYFGSIWLYQNHTENPFVIARDEFARLRDSREERRERFALGLVYACLHRDCQDWPADTVLAMLSRPEHLENDIMVGVLAPPILSLLPEALTAVSAPEGHVPIDVRVSSNASYDSVASTEAILINAAGRGVKAVAIADRSRIDGWQRAQRVAERLKLEGKIPRDFLVIPGQLVHTHTGAVLALFTTDIIPDRMTMRRAISCVHHDGGLAYLVHPGVPGGPERLENLEFDGYLIQPGMFEMYRTLSLLNDPGLAGKTGLTASNSLYPAMVGLPYSVVEAGELSLDAIRKGLRDGKVYAAGGLYLPWMTVASFEPVARSAGLLNRYFMIHRYAEKHLAGAIGADSVTLSTSWDDEIESMMGITGMPKGITDLIDGTSPFYDPPRIGYIAAEYSFLQISYDHPTDTVRLQATFAW